ncbi:MAG TPA: hypothetical protein VMU32_02110 [Solirubrobacteraceae bacterium]|nr:hypothetical protein [Solirubrobacteraceae bacterium]
MHVGSIQAELADPQDVGARIALARVSDLTDVKLDGRLDAGTAVLPALSAKARSKVSIHWFASDSFLNRSFAAASPFPSFSNRTLRLPWRVTPTCSTAVKAMPK